MPFLLGASSFSVKSPAKENTLKSMPLKMTSSKKTHPENRGGQSKAVDEAASSCQAPCHNIPPQFFPSEIWLSWLEAVAAAPLLRQHGRSVEQAVPCCVCSVPRKANLLLGSQSHSAERTFLHGGGFVFPTGCAGGLPNQAVVSQQQF